MAGFTIEDRFMEALRSAGLEVRMIEKALKDPDLAVTMVQALEKKLGRAFVDRPFRFTSAAEQLLRVRKANRERPWGFTKHHFDALGEAPTFNTAGDRHNLIAVVLEVVLPDSKGKTDVDRTLDELWTLAAAQQKNSSRYAENVKDQSGGCIQRPDRSIHRGFNYDPIGGGRHYHLLEKERRVRLAEGVKAPAPGLRWRKVDLGAHWKRKTSIHQLPKNQLPHAAILAAAWHHPNWVRAMDGLRTIPYVQIPGLASYDFADGTWSDTPSLIYEPNEKRRETLIFCSGNGGLGNVCFATPVFV